ncbi:MAG: 5-formyltetrahydrofolate cyclo-ligase [Muribaculaceae bacterium]|nr:5-formyltetrahydrofolate cyclo-ligase [Muribaculaceae bacterium]MBQ7204578.1 5-formyltetrahydrofolate cyclo-ligase [Muribaculaceae bacterium]
MTKKELRKQIKDLKAITPVALRQVEADMVFNTIKAMPVWQQVQHILCYWSLPDELPTHETVNRWLADGKSIYLPRVVGDDLEIVPYHGAESLDDNNKFHIGEPVGAAVDPSCLELIIVPAVALDAKRNRLGRGKGFYDRLLSTTTCPTIGVACDFQLVDEVPVEPHDRPLDCVVTSDTVIANPDKQNMFA